MSKAIYRIDEDLLQLATVANCGRELTEKELKRAYIELFENGNLFGEIYGGLVAVAERVMNEDGRWNETDKDYENQSLDEMYKEMNINTGFEANC